MSLERKIKQRTARRVRRVRGGFAYGDKPRVSVFRSLKAIYAQVIDDRQQRTLVTCSSRDLAGVEGDKKTVAHAVGKELAKRALEKGISVAVFDRGAYLYHGRVKALADGLREGGLEV